MALLSVKIAPSSIEAIPPFTDSPAFIWWRDLEQRVEDCKLSFEEDLKAASICPFSGFEIDAVPWSVSCLYAAAAATSEFACVLLATCLAHEYSLATAHGLFNAAFESSAVSTCSLRRCRKACLKPLRCTQSSTRSVSGCAPVFHLILPAGHTQPAASQAFSSVSKQPILISAPLPRPRCSTPPQTTCLCTATLMDLEESWLVAHDERDSSGRHVHDFVTLVDRAQSWLTEQAVFCPKAAEDIIACMDDAEAYVRMWKLHQTLSANEARRAELREVFGSANDALRLAGHLVRTVKATHEVAALFFGGATDRVLRYQRTLTMVTLLMGGFAVEVWFFWIKSVSCWCVLRWPAARCSCLC